MPSEEGEWVALSVRLEIKPPTALHTLPLPVVAVAMAVAALLAGTPDSGLAEGGGRWVVLSVRLEIKPPAALHTLPLPGVAVAVAQRRRARPPDSGGAQAGGVSPPFTVCAHSWFEVWGGALRLLYRLLGSACFAVRCAGCSVALALLLGAGGGERHE